MGCFKLVSSGGLTLASHKIGRHTFRYPDCKSWGSKACVRSVLTDVDEVGVVVLSPLNPYLK